MPPPAADLSHRLHDHAAFLRALARRLVRDTHAADDLVQEAFVRALHRPPHRVASLRAWLATIVRNVWRDQRSADAARAQRERQSAVTPEPTQGGGGDPFGIEQLNAALHSLPAEYRHVLQARYYAQQAPAAIAAALGVPLATVKSRLVRALELLRADMVVRCGGERRLRHALAPLAGFGGGAPLLVAGSGSVLMAKKAMLALAAAVALAGTWWTLAWVGGGAAADPLPGPAVAVASAVGPDADAGAAAAAPTPARERVALAAAGAAEARALAGRVVDATNGDGIPFVVVQARSGNRRAVATSGRDGGFVLPGTWPAGTEIGAPGLRAPGAVRPVRSAPRDHDEPAGPAIGAVIPAEGGSLAVNPPATPPAAQLAEPEVQWRPLAAFAAGERVDVAVAMPPTWFVRTAGAAAPRRDLGLAFVDRTAGSATWWPAFAGLAPLRPLDEGDVLWCRRPLTHTGRAPELVVASDDGFWCGTAPVAKRDGVVGPIDVVLAPCGVVVGTVRDRAGAPVAGAVVIAAVATANGVVRGGARSGDDGAFRLAHLPAGAAMLRVVGERFEAVAEHLAVVAGVPTRRDLTVTARDLLGVVAGTVVPASGDVFFHCSVVLSSSADASVWRTAPLTWRRGDDGRAVGAFAFRNVPTVGYDVALQSFAPCTVATPVLRCTPPATDLTFAVDDRVAVRAVRFELAGAAAADHGAWSVHVTGDGWSLRGSTRSDGSIGVSLPIGQRVRWRACGPSLRAQCGELLVTAEPPGVIGVPRVAGCSLRIAAVAIANFHPARELTLCADGVEVGRTDEHGELWLDLAAAPRLLTLDARQARVFRDGAHDSDVDPLTGAWRPAACDGNLDLYIEPIR